MSQIAFKKQAYLNDNLLGKRELRKKIIYTKMIQATQNLNNYFGVGNYCREQLFERINLYLTCDGHKTICLRTFDNYLQRFKTLNYQNLPLFSSRSHKLGENCGSTFSAEVPLNALHSLNKMFYEKKLAVVTRRKIATVQYSKIADDIVYYKNLFNSLVKKEQRKAPVCEKPTNQPEKSKRFSPTEQVSSSFSQLNRFSSGTQAYKQALRDLETMRIGQVLLKEIERTLSHPIARENATLNLRDFLRDLGEEKRQSGMQVYLEEIKSLNSSMRLMRKGSEKYNTLLEETLNPKPKLATRIHSGVLLPSEQNARFGIKPASQEEIEAIWKDFIERKVRDKRV